MKLKTRINILTELTKIRITIFVTLTTVFGYISASGKIQAALVLPTIGLLLLACGAAVINHIQEADTDILMDRTKNRPIPSGKISKKSATVLSIFLVISGSVLLLIGGGKLALALGLLNLVWYNIIYTPLKKINPLAIIPGSLVGAIPPVVGWVSAGGSIFDPQILIISFFFFIWQIPHFWLLLLVFNEDYIKAGFPTLTKIFTKKQLARITFIWIIATVEAGILILLYGNISSTIISIGLFLVSFWLIVKAFELLFSSKGIMNFKFAFRQINTFVLAVVFLVSIDKLVF